MRPRIWPSIGDRGLNFEALLARLTGCGQVLGAVFDPFHRTAELLRRRRAHDVLAVGADLQTERPADVAGADSNLLHGYAGRRRQRRLDESDALARDPHEELLGGGVVAEQSTPGLHGDVLMTVLMEPGAHNEVGGGEGAFDVAVGVGDRARGDVAAEGLKDEGSARIQRLLRGCHRRELFVVDFDQLAGVFGQIPGLGDHQGNRIAHQPDLVGGQHGERRPSAARHRQDAERTGAHVGLHVAAGVDRDDPRCLPCGAGVDAADPGMREGAAQEAGVEHPWQLHVGDVVAPASENPRVLFPPHRAARVALSDHHVVLLVVTDSQPDGNARVNGRQGGRPGARR